MRPGLSVLAAAAALIASGVALLLAQTAAAPAEPKQEERAVSYTTAECYAFWKLLNKLQGEGVLELLANGPQGGDGGLPPAEMQRVTLYLDLEERLWFRCPDFAPPPEPRPADAAVSGR